MVPSRFKATTPARKLDRIAFSRFILSSTGAFSCKGILLDEGRWDNSERKRRGRRERRFCTVDRHGPERYLIDNASGYKGFQVGKIERGGNLSATRVDCGYKGHGCIVLGETPISPDINFKVRQVFRGFQLGIVQEFRRRLPTQYLWGNGLQGDRSSAHGRFSGTPSSA